MTPKFTIMMMVLLTLVSHIVAQDEPTTFSLQILHSSDNESSFQMGQN